MGFLASGMSDASGTFDRGAQGVRKRYRLSRA
jgi:hypothetical protein